MNQNKPNVAKLNATTRAQCSFRFHCKYIIQSSIECPFVRVQRHFKAVSLEIQWALPKNRREMLSGNHESAHEQRHGDSWMQASSILRVKCRCALAKKRRHERYKKTTPAILRQGEHAIAATTRDVSLGGLFLLTDIVFREGTEIEVVLLLPKEIGLSASSMVCCHCTIVRTERVSGQVGVAVKIESFEEMPEP
jgi:hypothetical protein